MTNTELVSKAPLSAHQRGMLLALTCYVLWCAGDAAVKAVALEGLRPLEIIAVFSWIASIMLAGLTAARGKLAALRPVDVRTTIIRSVVIVAAEICIVIAFAHLSLALFYAIIFLSPFFVALGARLFLGEALPWNVGLVILAGFAGVVIAVDPAQIVDGKGEIVGIVAALGSAAAFSVAQLMLRHMSRTETPETLVFSGMLVGAIVTSVPAYLTLDSLSWKAFAILTLAAAINVAANLAMTTAMRVTTAANVAGLHYSQIIPGAIFGYLLWNEIPAWNLWVGSAVIIAAGLAMARLAHRRAD